MGIPPFTGAVRSRRASAVGIRLTDVLRGSDGISAAAQASSRRPADRQLERDARAALGAVAGVGAAAVRQRRCAGPAPGPARASRGVRASPPPAVEAIEDARLVAGREAGPAIADLEHDRAVARARTAMPSRPPPCLRALSIRLASARAISVGSATNGSGAAGRDQLRRRPRPPARARGARPRPPRAACASRPGTRAARSPAARPPACRSRSPRARSRRASPA